MFISLTAFCENNSKNFNLTAADSDKLIKFLEEAGVETVRFERTGYKLKEIKIEKIKCGNFVESKNPSHCSIFQGENRIKISSLLARSMSNIFLEYLFVFNIENINMLFGGLKIKNIKCWQDDEPASSFISFQTICNIEMRRPHVL